MFKIDEPELNNLKDIKYQQLDNKEKLENLNLCNENIKLDKNVEIKNSKFDGILFDEVSIKFGNLEDVEFINCDLSNISFMDTSFYRVKFKNCKLFGINFIDSDLDNVVIEDCMCNMSNIAGVKIKNSKISNSNFKDSRVMSCSFKNLISDYVNFSNSEFINTALKDIDLSNSNIDEIKIDLNSIKGAIISFQQSMSLIGLLGVKIKE